YVAIELYKAVAYKALTQRDPQFYFDGYSSEWKTAGHDNFVNYIGPGERHLGEAADEIENGDYSAVSDKLLGAMARGEADHVKFLHLLRAAPDPDLPGGKTSLLAERIKVLR